MIIFKLQLIKLVSCIIRENRYSRNLFIVNKLTYDLVEDSKGMFDTANLSSGRIIVILNLALKAGSSKQGKARLASVGWNWVVAMTLRIRNKYCYLECKFLPNSVGFFKNCNTHSE